MRNYITPKHCPLSDAAIEKRHVSSVANSNQRLELVQDDRIRDASQKHFSVPSKVVPSTSDFEGFGSFSG
ncbi:hypothetical protein [Methylobacterium sp. V23]|uniref:hypothetical protein n=1 Tax=Methylobacterium sp. V23 TaxID=2044878 RepID=UPI000CDAFBF0|nr:hypothetical protein [Methylobacterium sp. V23]POR42694.1 hypothetical protein CRT23_11210 [Methylobacterium sp. V23]